MKKNKNNLIFLSTFALLFVFVGVYFIQNKDVNKKNELAISLEPNISEEENIEVEIINEEQGNEREEIILESDAEQLKVIEESEKNDNGIKEEKRQQTPSILLAPLKKKNDPDTLKIGLITDLHVQSDYGSGLYLNDHYTKKINYFVKKMNDVFSPNFILLNGDVIEGTKTSPEIGRKELLLVKNLIDRTTIKKYWVAGNHDLRSLSKKQWMDTLNINYISKSFDVGNYKIIILDSNFTKEDLDVKPGVGYLRGNVSQKQMEWLRRELKKTKKKVIVFMHHPPLRDIDAKINSSLLFNARDLQAILTEHGVLAVFSGHIEDLYYQEIGGVDYFVSPGIIKHPKYQGAFSEITVKKENINITLNYIKEDGNYRTIEIKK